MKNEEKKMKQITAPLLQEALQQQQQLAEMRLPVHRSECTGWVSTKMADEQCRAQPFTVT